MQPGRLMPGHSTGMQQPESTEVSSLYCRTTDAEPGIKLSRVVWVLVPPPHVFQAGRGRSVRVVLSRSSLSISVGDSGGVTWAGELGQKMPPWIFPSCPGLCAWNLTINPALAPQALEVVFHPPPAFASAG